MTARTAAARFMSLVMVVAGLAVAAATMGSPASKWWAPLSAQVPWIAATTAVAGCALLLCALVPRTLVAATAGLLFGALPGAAYAVGGTLLAAAVAYGAGRWLGRGLLVATRRGRTVDRWITGRGVVGVVTMRLLPVAPFGLVSYAYGTTGVPFQTYLLGTLFGGIPGTVVYAALGSTAATPWTWEFLLTVTAAGTVAVAGAAAARRRRKAQGTGAEG